MDAVFLSRIVEEIAPLLIGQQIATVWASEFQLIIDLDLKDRRVLVSSLDPSSPALYLASRHDLGLARTKARHAPAFVADLHDRTVGSTLRSLSKRPGDRIVDAVFEYGESRYSLTLALTGRSANAYLVGEDGTIESKLLDTGPFGIGDHIETRSDVEDPAALPAIIPETAPLEEIHQQLKQMGGLLKIELATRGREAGPAVALRSLRADMFENRPVPLVYSRWPLDRIASRVINAKIDLLLSHFRLHSATSMHVYEFGSLSEAAQQYYAARRQALELHREYDHLRQRLQVETKKRSRTIEAIDADLSRLGVPEVMKRFGDLLLANLVTARVEGRTATVIDYYDPEQKQLEIDMADHATLQETAEWYYQRYQKARRAKAALVPRSEAIQAELEVLTRLSVSLDAEPTAENVAYASNEASRILGKRVRVVSTPRPQPKKRAKEQPAVGRRFVSSDGYEILIGKNDSENDAITFRVARSNDVWLHAADYPGSHVLIRNPRKDAVPFRTVVEAAQLAAFYSQARNEGKAAVRYTQRKYVSKPPRSKAGLVRLSSFKTVLVEPKRKVEQDRD